MIPQLKGYDKMAFSGGVNRQVGLSIWAAQMPLVCAVEHTRLNQSSVFLEKGISRAVPIADERDNFSCLSVFISPGI